MLATWDLKPKMEKKYRKIKGALSIYVCRQNFTARVNAPLGGCVLGHSPWCTTETSRFCLHANISKTHWLLWVLPSEPHTGLYMNGHSSGHTASAAVKWIRKQWRCKTKIKKIQNSTYKWMKQWTVVMWVG